MVNTLKIKGRIAELGLTQESVALKMGIAPYSLSLKINNKRDMPLKEVHSLAVILDISPEDYVKYFFTQEVA